MEVKAFKGYPGRIIFSNTDTQYQIREFKTKEEGIVVMGGVFLPLIDDILYEIKAQEIEHPRYGKQYKVISCISINDDSKEGFISFLASERFKGVGKKTAERIYDFLGPECLDMISGDPDCLKPLRLSKKIVKTLHENILANKQAEAMYVKLYELGLTTLFIAKLEMLYGLAAYNRVVSNPYAIIEDLEGFGFLKADKIATSLGFANDDPRRTEALIFYIMNEMQDSYGGTYITQEQLITEIKNKDRTELHATAVDNAIHELAMRSKIVTEENRIYLKYTHIAEVALAKLISDFASNSYHEKYETELLEGEISLFEEQSDIRFSTVQRDAIMLAIKNQIAIISGGPGTGKTTLIKAIYTIHARLMQQDATGSSILLCAPTGKAAKRIREKTQFPASTIHRALGYNYDHEFAYDDLNKLPHDLIIIDEFSMVDNQLAWYLLRAVKQNAKVILVGDSYQLPSVGCGDVLNDLIISEVIPTIFLVDIFRQQKGSGVISLANSIRTGHIGQEFDNTFKDVIFYPANEFETMDVVLRNIKYLLDKGYSLHDDVQVLIPIYKGQNGINNANKEISGAFNKKPRFIIESNEQIFKEGDKVLQTKNNKELELMNGDLGVIKKEVLSNNKGSIETKYQANFADSIVELKKSDFQNIQLAYAISVHKAQGSEFPFVILPLLREYSIMLKRKLIYTAVTRAKEQLFIIGDLSLLNWCIERVEEKRQTSLALRLLSKEKTESYISPYDFME